MKRQALYQDFSRGGLRATNVSVWFKGLRLAWIQRLSVSESNATTTWKTVSDFFFTKHGEIYFLSR